VEKEEEFDFLAVTDCSSVAWNDEVLLRYFHMLHRNAALTFFNLRFTFASVDG